MDNLIANKLADLQQYVPFMKQVINNLKNNNNDKPRPQQLQKMEMLFSLITNQDKKPLKLETLVKCETVVQKIYNKIEKQKDDSSNSSPATVDLNLTSANTIENQEIIEITEPDSPTVVDDCFHAPPIVIPTERKESPQPQSNHLYKNRKNSKWDNTISESKREDELIDSNFRRRIPTIDKSRNRSNDRFTSIFDQSVTRDYRPPNENEIFDNRRNHSSCFESDIRNCERKSRFDINYDTPEIFDIPTISGHTRNFAYSSFDKSDDKRSRYNLKIVESSENDFLKKNDNFPQHNNFSESRTFSEHLLKCQRDKYYRESVRPNQEEPQFDEWLQHQNLINQERHSRETIDFHKTNYDYQNDSRNIINRISPPRPHSRNHNRRDFDRTEKNDRLDNWDIDDNSPDRSHLGALTSFDIRRHQPRNQLRDNLVQVPIEQVSQATTRKIKQNEQLNNSRMLNSKLFDISKTIEEPDNSIFNRLGNKIDITENFQIKVKNDRAIPISKAPLIKDVLKSPPLSADDIDELYHESGGEVDNSFDAVRKKLAKISSKLKDDSLNKSPINSQKASIKSPDPNRLAYKYNPHPRVSLEDPLSPKASENTSKSAEISILKLPIDPRIQNNFQPANSLPSVNPKDPRLKTWSCDLNTQIPQSSTNCLSSSIPSLLELNIPPILNHPQQNKDVLSKTQLLLPSDGVLDVDKNIHSPVNNLPETTADSLNYKKFHPLLNDQVERIKYLEAKKNKPNTDVENKKATTYKEHRLKIEENKLKRDSGGRFATNKIDKSKSKDKEIKNPQREKSGKIGDTKRRPFESRDSKYDKSKDCDKRRNDSIGNFSNNRNDINKSVPNCLDSMYRTSNYKKDLGSVASFKIPKKGKEEDKSKIKDNSVVNEQVNDVTLGKPNIKETPMLPKESKSRHINKEKISDKTKADVQYIKESVKSSLISTIADETSELYKKTDVEELTDVKIQPIMLLKDETIKINLLKKDSEICSPSSIEPDSDDNWVVLSEIGTENPTEESDINEEKNSISHQENQLVDLVEKIESPKNNDIISKPIKSRRKSVYDIVVNTSDNSVVSTQNIISGKRRRSLINLNENLLAIAKVQITAAETANLDLTSTTHQTKKLTPKFNSTKKSKVKNKRQENLSPKLTSPQLTNDLSILLPAQGTTSTTSESNLSSTITSEELPQSSVKKEEISKNSLESFLLDMLNPTTNKSRVLEMLEKVLDMNKFQQVKKIIEDDDTDNKKESAESKEEDPNYKINESQLKVNKIENAEDSALIVKQEICHEKRKQKKKLTELDRLNVDIRDMFISKGVITATGRRMCTMMKAAAEEHDSSVDRPLSRQQQTKYKNDKDQSIQSKQNTKTKKISTNTTSESHDLNNLNKVPKLVLSKVDISTVAETVPTKKIRKKTRKRKRYSWSKGIISKKTKKLAASKKIVDNSVEKQDDNKIENIEDENVMVTPTRSSKRRYQNTSTNKMPVLKPITPVKSPKTILPRDKPCPKSKKKFYFSNDDESILIGDEPIIDNSLIGDGDAIFIDPSMPILTTISHERELSDLPKTIDLLNVTKLKNIYSGMHAKSEYSNKCVLCKFTGSKVANHYTVNHPGSEVFISRLPPDTMKDLLANKNNCALYSFRKQQSYVYHYRCPFCDIQQSFSRKSWIDHFSTHTGEYAYKCSKCNRSMNMKHLLMSHFQNVCTNGEIIPRPQLSKDIRLVEAFVCNLCSYVQMVEENIVKHLKDQHDILNDYHRHSKRIILINIQNIPLLDGIEEQQQAVLADSIPKTTMDFIDPSQSTETDKLDAFVPKEQSDLSLDKNFLNYMNDMSFSTAESPSQLINKSSIIDQLSERLQSKNEDPISFNNSTNTKPIIPINRRYSIADQLSKRFQTVDQQQDKNNKLKENTTENTTNNDGTESPIPVVYILDNLDDDIDNVELAESSEQLIVPVDKPISVARANKLNEMVNESNRNTEGSTSDKNILNSSSIIARLNERFKSPQKKQTIKNKEVLQEKTSISRSGTMIIDRLNKRLNSIDEREKPDNCVKSTNSSQLSNDSIANTQNQNDDLLDTSDDKLIIDESDKEDETILNETTGVLQSARTFTEENEKNMIENSDMRISKDSECIHDADEQCSADDDDWEDIEIMPASFDSNTKLSTTKGNNSTIEKNKNGTFYQTLSRLYAASIKSKNKSAMKNKKSVLKNKLIEDKKCSKKTKLTDINDGSTGSPISHRLPDLVTDAIPSPVPNELTVNPPVPLPSEPLSDLNDISEILEPSTNNDTAINTHNDNALDSPIDLCDIDDDDIFILNDETNIEDALALAAEIEKPGDDLQNELELDSTSFVANKTASTVIVDNNTTPNSTAIDPAAINNGEINKNKTNIDDILPAQQITKYRIDKLGFSITNGKIKYLCLVDSCSFLYSELEIGLQNHYILDHPNLTWDGFCYSCESLVCFDGEHLPLVRELKHMNEVHINNMKKMNYPTNRTTQKLNLSIPEKPKISLRRLSGDMLSIQPTCININEDQLCNITQIPDLSKSSTSKSKSTDSSKLYSNKITPVQPAPKNLLKNIQVQYSSIKKLLNTPSIPPPVPPTLLENRTKSPVITNNQFGMGNSLLKKNLDNIKVYRPPITPTHSPVITQSTLGHQPIKNNAFGGSNLLISSVAEGVRLPTPTKNNQASPACNESVLKIQSVCSLNSNQNQLSTPVTNLQQQSKISVTTTIQPVNKTPTITNESINPLKIKVIPPTNSGSMIVTKQFTNNRIQPWLGNSIQSTPPKLDYVVQLQLRAISLYAFYKCMSSTCFFSTNCSDKLKKHFICHEFSGATTNKSAALESNINYRDWLNCAYCKYHAETSEELLQHLNDIHINDIYQCPYCFYRSCCECNVQLHQKNHHVGRRPLIYVAFGDRKKLALEIRFLAKNRAKFIMPVPCNDCPQKFYLLRNYNSHLRENHNINSEVYTCGICKIVLQKKSASYHLSTSHNISIYQCIYCNESSSMRSRMILHMADEHPSNLLYSCVRVSPNKNMDISEETIENSTVLANLTEIVDSSILVESNFTLDQLNFMSPSLDVKSLQDNRSGINILTTPPPNNNINRSLIKTSSPPQQNQSKNLKIITVETLTNAELISNSTSSSYKSIDPSINSSVNITKSLTSELQKSPDTLKISSILQNCPKFITTESHLKSPANIKTTNEITTNYVNKSVVVKDKIPESIVNTNKHNDSPSIQSNDDNLNDRIIKAAKELVQDTGYEGYDLYRCAYQECSNIKITETTLIEHIQKRHSRVRSLKCPHCTSQYQSSKTLRHHLNTHRMHRYFCYFCNYTAITQQIIVKHINDSHSKNVNITTVALAYSNNSSINNNSNENNDIFHVTCPSNTSRYEISQYGERLIRICDRKKSLTKKTFKPDEIDQLPMQSIFHHEVICSQCNYKTKVRVNMYRHLLYHTREIVVPSIDPVNPVPCLNTSEKHYDKMINLACSSNTNRETNISNEIKNTPISSDSLLKKSNETTINNIKPDRKIPEYIPSMKRFVCGVNGCNYLTITDAMLKHHLNALHLTEKSYKCSHCKIECVKKQLCPDKIIQHLKFHDSKIIVCSECPYIHYQKHLVERHIYEKHPNKTINLINYERTDTDTIVNHQSCGSYNSSNIEANKNNNNNTKNIDDDMAWECTICKHKTINSMEMSTHVSNAHNIRFRYACLHCKFGAGQFKTVMEHITDKHPTKDRKVKCAFNRVDETPVVTDDFLQQDNRPLWSRADPHRVKNIRGILMEEEEDETINTSLNINNEIAATSSTKSLDSKKIKTYTKSKQNKIDVQNNKEKNNRNEIQQNSTESLENTTDKTIEKSVDVDIITNNESNNLDIYECSYCPVKNISFKTIYTHWLLHHCEKPTQTKSPLLSKPFSFKLWGFMSQENSNEIELKMITQNDLQRLKRLGQRATRFQCNECWRLFANSSSVSLHQETEHKYPTSSAPRCLQYKNVTFYICNFCGYASSMECKTAAHLLNHYGGFKKCHICNVQFQKFLDFVSHLPSHDITFNDFIENDNEIISFWNQVKILFPNGLCTTRGIIPNNLNNNVLQHLVIEQINNAILGQTKSIKPNDNEKIIEPEKEPIAANSRVENNADKDSAPVASKILESENATLTTTTSIVQNESIAKSKTKKRIGKKRSKDNEWMPGAMKRRKIQSETEDDDDDESDEDFIPLKYLTDDSLFLSTINKSSPLISTDNNSTIFVPKRKPGPKCMQQKPYSFYGLKPEKMDLNKIYTTMTLGNDKPVVVSCENFARFVNIEPRICIEKFDVNNISQSGSVTYYKRKLSHLINNIIDEQLGYNAKKFRETP